MDNVDSRVLGRASDAIARAQAALDPEDQARLRNVPVRRTLELIDAIPAGSDYYVTTPELEALDAGLLVEGGPEWSSRYWNLALLHLLARGLERGRPYVLPPGLHQVVIGEFERIVAECERGRPRNEGLSDGDLLLDLGFSRGMVIPFGPAIGVAPVRPPAMTESVQPPDERPWVHTHIDSRHPSEVSNENLWDGGVLLVAQFLRANPDYGGMFGFGWLPDPRMGDVSPHLAFIRQLLEAGGATIVDLGHTHPDTIEQATSTSRGRRRLFEEGKWTPSQFGVLWPREAYLDWAESRGITT